MHQGGFGEVGRRCKVMGERGPTVAEEGLTLNTLEFDNHDAPLFLDAFRRIAGGKRNGAEVVINVLKHRHSAMKLLHLLTRGLVYPPMLRAFD